MSNNTFKITVHDLPRKHLVGNWMSLNAATDLEDYAAVWQVFFNRLKKVPELGPETGYGVCANLQENLDCHYWTAIEVQPGRPVPRGMVPLAVSDGPYVCLTSVDRVGLDEAYEYLCNQWERSQSTFEIDRLKPWFEQVECRSGLEGGFKLCVPLRLRNARQVVVDQAAMVATAA